MLTFVQLVILVVAISGLALFAFLWSERHARHRYAQWRCSNCGETFGRQEPNYWSKLSDPAPKGRTDSQGPILKCSKCTREFLYGHGGELEATLEHVDIGR